MSYVPWDFHTHAPDLRYVLAHGTLPGSIDELWDSDNCAAMVVTQEDVIMKETEPHQRKFEWFEKNARKPAWLFPLRKAGIARFAELGFPTLKDEDWRFTNTAPLLKLPFRPALQPISDGLTANTLAKFTFGQLDATRLVFVNGHLVPELSSSPIQQNGVKVKSLGAALAEDPDLLEKHLGRYALDQANSFSALNSAFFQDGGFIYLGSGKILEKPVHLLFVSTIAEPGMTAHPRNLVVLEKNSKATVIESYVSTVQGAYFTNAVTELVLEENAALEHCKLQDESLSAFHIAAVHAHLGRKANLIAHSFATGARLSRNDIRTKLAAEGVECVLNGLYLTRDDQLADHHMIVEHAQPHCNSHEYYNGILDGRSKGVFHGRILVRQPAQKTDAKQTNKNLLLSDEATADTKPQLEIYADDVKCTHGATVGQLNEESIFYLRARGIGAERARHMLIHAFAGEITERIRYAPVREELDRVVWERLESNPQIAGKD
ncbi:MAG TPA: Fe-S cluster assembly protein SufD [Patescibacteria group bacterium]|nr:Fe-S cluster assembly protein SufD [Patescibacteria group bacterium]